MSPAAVHARRRGTHSALLGMILFITSETMFFGGLFGAYFTVRAAAPAWPPEGFEVELLVPGLISVLLLSSSVTVHLAVAAATRGDLGGFSRWMGATIALALAFLTGQAYEYSQLGFAIGDGVYGTLFYSMTGFHGLHVFIGVVMLALALANAHRSSPARRGGQIEAAAYYWHFVDAVWVLLFTTLYLLR